ncbi:hypothetical protein DFH06DRAFT_1090143, partial [Mycena polygramma]
MLGMWTNVSRSLRLPFGTDGLMPLPHSDVLPGSGTSQRRASYCDTLTYLILYASASISPSPRSPIPMHLLIIPQSLRTPPNSRRLLTTKGLQTATWAPFRRPKSNILSAHSNHLPYLSLRSHIGQRSSDSSRIFLSHIPLLALTFRLIHVSILIAFPPPGAHSRPFPYPSPDSPQARKALAATSPRRIAGFPCISRNGQVLLSVLHLTALIWTSPSRSDPPLAAVFSALWATPVRTSFAPRALDRCTNGWMITTSCAFVANTSLNSIDAVQNRIHSSVRMAAGSSLVAATGLKAPSCQTIAPRSLTRTCHSPSVIYPSPRRVRSTIPNSRITSRTWTGSPTTWATLGSFRKTLNSAPPSPSRASGGIYRPSPSLWAPRKNRNIERLSRNGCDQRRTPSTMSKSCMGNYSTHPLSFPQGARISQTSNQCWVFSMTAHSNPVLLLPDLPPTLNGGPMFSRALPSAVASPAHARSLTARPFLMQVPESASQSLSKAGGERGGSFLDGKQLKEISDGLKLSALSSSSAPFSVSPPSVRTPTLKSTETIRVSSRAGGTAAAETLKSIPYSGGFTSSSPSQATQFIQDMSQLTLTPPTIPRAVVTPHAPYFYLPCPSPTPFVHLSSTSMHPSPLRKTPPADMASSRTMPGFHATVVPTQIQDLMRSAPISQAASLGGGDRAQRQPRYHPYRRGLALAPSPLRPKCLARE